MFKLILTAKRRAGLTQEEFVEYYDNHHLAFFDKNLPAAAKKFRLHRRNYLNQDHPILKLVEDARADSSPPFDCITEVEFENIADAEMTMKTIFDPQFLLLMKQDEACFMDVSSIKFYVVDVHETSAS